MIEYNEVEKLHKVLMELSRHYNNLLQDLLNQDGCDVDKIYNLWTKNLFKVELPHIDDFKVDWISEFNALESRYEGEIVTYEQLAKYAKGKNIQNWKIDLIKNNIGKYIIQW